jgi:dTDP-glucose 4,6-dehydratase
MIVNILLGKPLPIYGDGRQVRDWLFVEDHCVAIDRIVQAPVEGRTFNVGGRAEHENVHIVDQLCQLLDERFSGDAALASRFPS